MIRCLICNQSYSRRDALQRHEHNVHGSGKYTDQSQPLKEMTFRHPFSMMVTGPSGSGKTEWTRKLLLSSLVQPPPERILWCFGQWEPLYEDLQKRIPCIEFIRGIPDYLDNAQFMDPSKRNLIIFDDLMTEAKCDQRIADLFTKGSHHRNISHTLVRSSLHRYMCTNIHTDRNTDRRTEYQTNGRTEDKTTSTMIYNHTTHRQTSRSNGLTN